MFISYLLKTTLFDSGNANIRAVFTFLAGGAEYVALLGKASGTHCGKKEVIHRIYRSILRLELNAANIY